MLIIGAHKCGTTSLQRYYEARGCDVVRNTQLFTRWDGPEVYTRKYSDRIPVVILRDPIERAWSDYHHRLRRDMIKDDMSYEHYCKTKDIMPNPKEDPFDYLRLGELNIIEISKYKQWLKNWHDIDPLVLQLEQMQQQEDFGRVNTHWHIGITQEQKKFTRELINDS